jgi:hypothetical protein
MIAEQRKLPGESKYPPEGLRPTAFKNPSACAENHSNPIFPKMIQMSI